MSLSSVTEYLTRVGFGNRVLTFAQSSATVAEAALRVGCEERRIAKTLSFRLKEGAVLIVTAGDARVDNARFKAQFCQKAVMLPHDEVETLLGQRVGGVCPFDVKAPVWLDASLKRFDTVYPAAGDDHSAVRLSPDELMQASGALGYVDVCKGWREEEL